MDQFRLYDKHTAQHKYEIMKNNYSKCSNDLSYSLSRSLSLSLCLRTFYHIVWIFCDGEIFCCVFCVCGEKLCINGYVNEKRCKVMTKEMTRSEEKSKKKIKFVGMQSTVRCVTM